MPQVTAENLRALGPRGNTEYIRALVAAAGDVLPAYGIDTPLRIAHFWAQAAHECDGFRTMGEYWGPTPAQSRYEGRRDLGNTAVGDGYKFRGRGIFQLTGRANYQAIGGKLGLDLIANPDLASEPVNALRIACEYWASRKLNALADKNDLVLITKRINGGTNGLADRRARFNTAWKIWRDSPVSEIAGSEAEKPAPENGIRASAVPGVFENKDIIMTVEQVGGIVRAIVAAVGGYFVGKGMVDSETVVAVGGALATIATAVWSVWSKK